MNRDEFLRQLESLLADIKETDRQEAIAYYTDYFEDAGAENEQNVIKELKSPEAVAKIIKQDLQGDEVQSKGEFTEKGYQNPYFEQDTKNEVVTPITPSNGAQNGNRAGEQGSAEEESKYVYVHKTPTFVWVLAAILFIPVGIPLLCVAFALFITACVVPASLILGFGIVFITLTVVGVGLVFGGILRLFIIPFEGIALIGAGLLLFGIGLLFAIVTKLCVSLLVIMFRGLIELCRLPFRKRVAV